ncbi:MAG: arylsulfatase A-like enzyme [Myxococcota bacterium]|jgi:arylsulfatase A-like enzyme
MAKPPFVNRASKRTPRLKRPELARRKPALRARPLAAITLSCLAAFGLGCEQASPPPDVKDLNVVLIVLDTTRADAVEGYGGADAHTPTLSKLASEGVLFRNARTTSAWTLPSHGSIFTALYPSRHGAHAEGGGIREERTTLSQMLGRTHATAGFSENPHIIEAHGFARGFDHFEETWREQEAHKTPPPTEARVAKWLEARDESEAFFLFVNLMTPHLPYAPPAAQQAIHVPKLDAKIIDNFRGVEEGHARLQMMGKLGFKRLDFSILRALYQAEVSYADERVATILRSLGPASVLDNTLVVVVSDHGENIGDHGLMEHQFSLHESLLRVPLIMRLPGTFTRGSFRDEPVQLVDIMPTILDVLEWPTEQWPAMEGRSLIGLPISMERPVYAEYMRPGGQEKLFHAIDPNFDFSKFNRRLKSIQVKNLKLITSDSGGRELFNLATDPDERRNLAQRQPEDADRLEARLLDWAGGWEPGDAESIDLDQQTEDALRELGYIE